MTRIAQLLRIAAAALLGALASACSTAGSTEGPDAPRDLVIRAADYSFSAPDTVPAGMVSVRLVNNGSEMHHVQLVRIGDGHTFDDLRQSAAGGNPIPPWVTPVGGPNAPSPGKTMEDLLSWARRLDGPPPGESNGGTTGAGSTG